MGEAEGRTSTAVVDKQQWLTSLQQAGFARDVLVFDDYPAPYDTTCTFLACPAPYLTNGTNGKHAATTQSDVTVVSSSLVIHVLRDDVFSFVAILSASMPKSLKARPPRKAGM